MHDARSSPFWYIQLPFCDQPLFLPRSVLLCDHLGLVQPGDLNAISVLLPQIIDVVMTTLHEAAKEGRLDVVQQLLGSGASAEALDAQQRTPLHYGAASGHLDVVQLLLDKGASVAAADAKASTALHHAADSTCSLPALAVLDNKR
jgi:ankyrin repeat protein